MGREVANVKGVQSDVDGVSEKALSMAYFQFKSKYIRKTYKVQVPDDRERGRSSQLHSNERVLISSF